MPRDYKPRQQGRAKHAPSRPWLWLFTGYLAGALTVGLVWLKAPDGKISGSGWIGAKPPAKRSQPVAVEPEPPKARFDFYTLLPEMEVVVPEDELEAEVKAAAPAPASKEAEVATAASASAPAPAAVAPESSYLLQVGSFRKAEDADRVKAQLALLGFHARVHKVSDSRGGQWYRVRVGPIAGATALKTVRDRLTSNGYKTMVIRSDG